MADIKVLPSKEQLNSLFTYDNDTGKLYWKISTNNRVKVGQEAGTPHKTNYGFTGYRQVGIDGNIYLVHRIIWTMLKGRIPDGYEIDHKDRDTENNRLSNFELVLHVENMKNSDGRSGTFLSKPPKTSKTGELYISPCGDKFRVYFPRYKFRGSFHNINDAIKCRNTVLEQYGRVI